MSDPLDANRDLMRRYSAAWRSSDPDAVMGCLAGDVVLRVPGRNRFSGDYHGRPAVVACIRDLMEHSATSVLSVEDVLVDADHAVAIERERALRGDMRFEWDRVVVYRLREGRVSAITIYDYDLAAVDAFFAE